MQSLDLLLVSRRNDHVRSAAGEFSEQYKPLCLSCRDEREQRGSEMEYLSQAVRAKAEECLAAVDDGAPVCAFCQCSWSHKIASMALLV